MSFSENFPHENIRQRVKSPKLLQLFVTLVAPRDLCVASIYFNIRPDTNSGQLRNKSWDIDLFGPSQLSALKEQSVLENFMNGKL